MWKLSCHQQHNKRYCNKKVLYTVIYSLYHRFGHHLASATANAAFDAFNNNTGGLTEDSFKWGTWQDLVRVSTWSFITWAGVWEDHWFAHTAGWHWPEASDHWLRSAGLIIYPVAYCLRCTAFLPSCPREHPALPLLRYFTMQRQDQERFLPSTNNAVSPLISSSDS